MKIIYCVKCLYPNTKPNLFFDKNGVCSSCINFSKRTNIDWLKRKIEFENLVKEVRAIKDKHHCVIPVSGGKDSTYQVIKCLEYGLNPLCVTATTDHPTEIGRKNIENIKNLGVDYIEVTTNPLIRKKINRIALETIGDISWPEHVAIFTIPVKIALQYKINLIIWGENPQNEYGGPEKDSEKNQLDETWLEEFGGLNGMRVSDLVGTDGINEKDILLYKYPEINELKEKNFLGVYLGYYFPWDGHENKLISEKYGFQSWHNEVEGSYTNYENLDNFQTGIHDYFCYLKFGFGRLTAQISMAIRRGRISRQKALEIIKKQEGKFPFSYLDKRIEDILSYIEMDISKFILICDKFTNKNIFCLAKNGSLLKDNNLNLKKINYDN